jgi:UDP-N-acetylmuramate: L-alanyl-gamma-D-glutamyl-meso-diaminopimelate ligase
MQRVHIIGIGNPSMGDLAIAIHKKNNSIVSGSDTQFSEATVLRLKNYNLLPDKPGWFPENIDKRMNAVITGIDVTPDNPELIKAEDLGLKIYSYPEYIYTQTRSKTRIVVSGSYGKSTIVAMILHVLKKQRIDADYLIEAPFKGFEQRVKLTYDARVAVFEGNESLTSPIDQQPKFHWYKPHIAVITGIAWNQANLFPTPEIYAEQFSKFIELIEIQGRLIYFDGDKYLTELTKKLRRDIVAFNYNLPDYQIIDGIVHIKSRKQLFPVKIFGEHNLQNLNAARLSCRQVGVTDEQFYSSLADFEGLRNHLEEIFKSDDIFIYRDIANSPSKLKASLKAIKNLHPSLPLIAFYEFQTTSNFNANYLPYYTGSLALAETAFVYVNSGKIPENSKETFTNTAKKAFGGYNVSVFNEMNEIQKKLLNLENNKCVYLLNCSDKFPVMDLINVMKKKEF